MPYVIDRAQDALDIVTITGGLGLGANVRFGPVTTPSIITQVNYLGIEGGDPFFGFGWKEGGTEFHGSVFSYIINGWQIGNLTETTKLRHKFYKAMYIFGMSTNKCVLDEPQYNYSYFTQIEAVISVGPAIKLGFNPGELIDFLLGWTIIDIYNDDINKQCFKKKIEQNIQPNDAEKHQ